MSQNRIHLSRRTLLQGAATVALTAPMLDRVWAADPVQINMLA